jgi:hypothetical protein
MSRKVSFVGSAPKKMVIFFGAHRTYGAFNCSNSSRYEKKYDYFKLRVLSLKIKISKHIQHMNDAFATNNQTIKCAQMDYIY